MTHDPLVPDDSKLYRLNALNMHQVAMLETLLIDGAIEAVEEPMFTKAQVLDVVVRWVTAQGFRIEWTEAPNGWFEDATISETDA